MQPTRKSKNKPTTLMGRLRSTLGQTTTEYILMLAIAVLIAMKFKSTIVGVVQTATTQTGSKITDMINE